MRIAPSGQDIRFNEKQSKKGETLRQNFGMPRAFGKCMDRAMPRRDRQCVAIDLRRRSSCSIDETIDAINAAYREYEFNPSHSAFMILSGAIIAMVRRGGED